jgi:transposase
MMGERRVDQAALFYEFSLDRHVPSDHLLRSIDRFVDLEELRTGLAPFYSPIGRPSIDPELLIRMLLVGYCFGIRSERRLCEEVHLNLAYRWFCRLDLDGDACRITRPSRRTATAVSARAICCASCSRPWCDAAWRRAWSAGKASPPTPT